MGGRIAEVYPIERKTGSCRGRQNNRHWKQFLAVRADGKGRRKGKAAPQKEVILHLE